MEVTAVTNAPTLPSDADLHLERLDAIATRATHITFFEDRAQVQRTAHIELPHAGMFAVKLTGITRFIDDQSLTVAIDGEGTLALVQIKREVVSSSPLSANSLDTQEHEATSTTTRDASPPRPSEEEAAALLTQRQLELRLERDELTAHIERLEARHAHLHDLHLALLAQLRLAPESEACSTDDFRASLRAIDGEIQRVEAQEEEAHMEASRLDEEIARHAMRLAQSNQLTHEIVAHLEVQICTTAPCALSLSLTYMTGGALWRPAHRARLTRTTDAPERGHIDLETRATIWQNTGERWRHVRCAFSTARPSQSAKPPILEDDILRSRPKTHEERHHIKVTARDETITRAGTPGTRQLDVMPGVDDGGEPLRYEAEATISIASTGKAHHVTIDRVHLPCQIDIVAFPELSPAAHLRARTIWSHTTPLLAGPVTLLREQEHAGLASLNFTAPGEPLDLGFGPLSTLRVQREVKRKALDKMLTRRMHHEHQILLHVANMGSRAVSLDIIERVPVSELEQVEIRLVRLEGSRPDEDGRLVIPLRLEPHSTRKLELRYEIVAAPGVSLDAF